MRTNIILSPHVYVPIQNFLDKSNGNYLEIGLFNGIGFAQIARAFPNKVCYGVDPFIEDGHTIGGSGKVAGENINDQLSATKAQIDGLDNVRLNVMTSHQFKDHLTHQLIDKYNITCVLIDGNHHYEYVVNDYELAMSVIGNKEGAIVFDDLELDGVNRAVGEFKEKYATRIKSEENISGVAVVLTISPDLPQ